MGKDRRVAGLVLAARYGYITNSLGYCGPAGTGRLLHDFVCRKGDPARARAAISGFEALYPYLQLIAARHGLDPLDERVVRAHFTGSPLLAGSWQEELAGLIKDTFSKRGLPQRLADNLASRVPAGAKPHHSFHVLFIHTITGRVPATRATENSCLISPAKYLGGGMVSRRLIGKDGRFGLPKRRKARIDKDFLGRVPKRGEWLALHWDFAAEIITARQAGTLRKYTERNLAEVAKAFN